MIYHGDAEARSKLFHEELTGKIIGAAIEVHRALGPGLLESAYEECLYREFNLRGLSTRLGKKGVMKGFAFLSASVSPW